MPVTIVTNEESAGIVLVIESQTVDVSAEDESRSIVVESATTPGPRGPAGGPDPGTLGYVYHGAVADTVRPTGYAAVYWVGSVEPVNMANGDIWTSTL
jgi:hypothetical protein